MEQSSATAESSEATPIFGAYRRGYDPVQVDRFVAEQQRRLDDALGRASESERKLAAAVGQLRELHRRVAVLESEDRSPQPAPLDALGERVQRILQEAWEGAYALRQQAEAETAAVRESAAGEAAEALVAAEQRAAAIVGEAERQAAVIDAEIERRRVAWNARLEEDRARAIAQLEHLHRQRTEAVNELLRLRATIEKAVEDLGTGRIAAAAEPSLVAGEAEPGRVAEEGAGLLAAPPLDPVEPAGNARGAEVIDDPLAARGGDEQPTVRVRAAVSGERPSSGQAPPARSGEPPVRLQRPLRQRRAEPAEPPSAATQAPTVPSERGEVAASWVPPVGEGIDDAGEAAELTALVRVHRTPSIPSPSGEPGHSAVFDFEEMQP